MDTVSSRGWEGHGYVKAVPSGDRLVIMAKTKSRSGPPPEITLILDFIAAPKLAIRDGVSEPYAWYSREFLRNLLIGQPIKFRVDRKIEGTTRNFGTAFTSDGQDVTEIVVSEGWASVKESPSYLRGDDTTRARLLRLEIAAKSGHLGMWSKSRSSRMPERRKISIVSDARKLFQEVQNKDLDAIVEYVRDGSSYRIVLVDYMVSIVFNLVGVSCPRLGRKTKEGEIMSTPEPYALEAKHFVEVRLLHRRIPVRLKMINKSGDMFMGEIVHPKGDIGMEILKRGLGRVLDWSLTYCSDHTLYVKSEKQAKTQQIRIWKNYENNSLTPKETFTGRVVEIVSGDTIVVLNEIKGQEQRVCLSSIRAKRMGSRGKDPEPYATEAKEYLRRLLVGKQVHVEIEYERSNNNNSNNNHNNKISSPTSTDKNTKIMTSPKPVIVLGGGGGGKRNIATKPTTTTISAPRRYASVLTISRRKNVAVSLVMQGLAECVRHRQDDPRSRYFDQLLDAEVKAHRAKRGIHSTGEPPNTKFRDLTLVKGASRLETSSLIRLGRTKAVVEYVFSGGRFKIFVPKENCFVFFALSGLRCPARARKSRVGEPLAEEAFHFSRTNFMQRDVEIEIEDTDKGGTMLGSMMSSTNQDNKYNVGVRLLELGLARLVPYSAERSPYRKELERASEAARESKLGIWKFQTEEILMKGVRRGGLDTSENEDEFDMESSKPIKVKISEVVNGNTFYVQRVSDLNTLELLKDRMMKDVGLVREVDTDFKPQKGMVCAASYGSPSAWYRAEITSTDGKKANITYIDFGNVEDVPLSRLRPLSEEFASLDRFALRCELSFVRVPSLDKNYGQDSAMYFGRLVWDQTLMMHELRFDSKTKTRRVILYTDDEKECINEELVSSGYARARVIKTSSKKLQSLLDRMRVAGEQAHKNHLGMYEYGDPHSDEEDEGY